MSYGPPPPPLAGPPPAPGKALPLLLGAAIGFVTTLLGVPLGVFGFSSGAGAGTDVVQVALSAFGWLPPLVGIGLLFSSRTRLWGAGILIGVATAWIVGVAACVVLLAVFLSGAGGGFG
jgi:hypothetical protein